MRRLIAVVGLGAAGMAGPGIDGCAAQQATVAIAAQPTVAADVTAAVTAFLDALWPLAAKAGVSRATFDQAVKDFAPDSEIAALNASQPEFAKTAGDYVGLLVSETRIAGGRAKLAELAALLDAVEARYGVDRNILVAIWGIESSYGTATGQRPVIRSLATLAMTDQRRGDFWRSELIAALRILEARDIAPEAMLGSWAGAMGHTQFMPSTFQRFAVDFDGDGKRDLWTTPVDALASAANYLKASGWVSNMAWGVEVRLPSGFDFGASGPDVSRGFEQWRGLGVVPVTQSVVHANIGPLQLILPAGANGPAFLVASNFKAILRYNRAVPYALAVGHLADRLAGGDGLATAWPSDDKVLTRGEREELQARLQKAGFDVGTLDGVIGTQTRSAVRAYQKARGLIEDGFPGAALFERLRAEAQSGGNAP